MMNTLTDRMIKLPFPRIRKPYSVINKQDHLQKMLSKSLEKIADRSTLKVLIY